MERGWKQNQREGREGRREGREEGRRGYEEKNQIQFKRLLSKCKAMLEEGGRRKKKTRRRRKRRGARTGREDQKREGGKESGKTEGKIARFTNKVKHRGRETREGWRDHSTTVLPKLPVEGKGVWPRLVRWNGVTPGR